MKKKGDTHGLVITDFLALNPKVYSFNHQTLDQEVENKITQKKKKISRKNKKRQKYNKTNDNPQDLDSYSTQPRY